MEELQQRTAVQRLKQERRGASLLSYGLMVGLVAVVALSAVTTSGSSVKSLFGEVSGSLDEVAGGAAATESATPIPTPVVVEATCAAHLLADSGLLGMDGLYTIDPDGTGGDAPFQVYCDMTNAGGGLTLVGSYSTNNYSPSKVSVVQPVDTSAILTDAQWSSIRDASNHLIMTTDDVPGWVRASIASASSASCKDMTNLEPWRSSRTPLLDRTYYAHNENSGCTVSGGDYCMIGVEHDSGRVRAINRCSSAPTNYVQSSSDGISWATPPDSTSYNAVSPTLIWLFAR